MPDNDSLFRSLSDLVYYSKNNAEALSDLNTAIKALYAIEAGALTAKTLNTATYVDEVIERLNVDTAEWASRLSIMRSLLFGHDMNWDYVQKQLAEIPDKSKDGGEKGDTHKGYS